MEKYWGTAWLTAPHNTQTAVILRKHFFNDIRMRGIVIIQLNVSPLHASANTPVKHPLIFGLL